MSGRNIWTIFKKELLDISRDRRALVFMIVLPIAVVPLLMVGMGKLLAFGTQKLLEEPSRIAVLNGEASPRLVAALRFYESPATSLPPPELVAAGMEEAEGRPLPEGRLLPKGVDVGKVSIFKVVPAPGDREATRRAIEKKEIEAAVEIPEGFDAALAAERPVEVTIDYDSSVDKSKVAHRNLADLLRRFERGVVLLERLPRHGIDKSLLDPIKVVDATVASKEQEGRAIAALILPYMLILMCFGGAVYPAIDLGAGEKERGTLETLLICPAARSELVLGKFFVIFATSLVAALLNIASLAFSLRTGLSSELGPLIKLNVDPWSAGVALVLMLPIAAVFAAVLLAISIFAKSFKEAQSYFAPFNIVIILPAFVSAIPGLELTRGLALVPIVNVSLAIKETLQGTYKWDCLGIIVVSTVALAAASVVFCTQWFKREEVLFRS